MAGAAAPPAWGANLLSGALRRVRPFCDQFGFTRGVPVDRYYIEGFLQAHGPRIRGRVLEIGESTYTRRFGGDNVERCDVLMPPPGGRGATVVGDLASGEGLPQGVFDCVIMTQTLECIYDCRAALGHACEMLRPGGTLLLTSGAIGHISRYDMDRWGDFWRFTPDALEAMCAECGEFARVQVAAHGNPVTATAFLHGLALHELPPESLDAVDPRFAILVSVCAQRAAGGEGGSPGRPVVAHACRETKGHPAEILSNAAPGSLDRFVCGGWLAEVYDLRSAVAAIYRALRPGGAVEAALPGVRRSGGSRPDYWRFTTASARRLFEEAFGPNGVQVASSGNVLLVLAALHDLPVDELTEQERACCDPDYQLCISVRAIKQGGS